MARTPTDVIEALVAAWNAKDPAAMVAVMAPDASFVNVFGGWLRGREAVQAAHEQAFAGGL